VLDLVDVVEREEVVDVVDSDESVSDNVYDVEEDVVVNVVVRLPMSWRRGADVYSAWSSSALRYLDRGASVLSAWSSSASRRLVTLQVTNMLIRSVGT